MIEYWASLLLAISFLLIGRRIGEGSLEGGATGHEVIKDRGGVPYSRICVVLSACVFIFLTGFRYGVGQDYFYTYVPYFTKVYYGGGQGDLEFGYYLLNWVVAQFTSDPTPVFFVCSVIFFFCTYSAIFRESSNPIMSVFLIFGMSFLFVFMNVMRQMVAVSILLYSIRFIERGKPVLFAASLVLASLFHSSALLFAVAYFFPRLKINPSVCLLIISCSLIFKPQLAGALNTLIGMTQYASYIGSRFDTGEAGNVVAAMNIVVMVFSIAVPYLEKVEVDGRHRLLLWCQMIATVVAILSGAIPLSQRLRWVFSLPSVILLPYTIQLMSSKHLRSLIQIAVVVLYVIYIAITIGMWNGNNVCPYQSVFFKE